MLWEKIISVLEEGWAKFYDNATVVERLSSSGNFMSWNKLIPLLWVVYVDIMTCNRPLFSVMETTL